MASRRVLLLGLTLGCGGVPRHLPAPPPAQDGTREAAGPVTNPQALAAYLEGELALARGEGEAAAVAFGRAARFDTGSAAPKLGEALAFEDLGRFADARLAVEAALEREGDCAPCLALLTRLRARDEDS